MAIGYLLLAVSVIGGVVKGYFGKKTSMYVSEPIETVLMNTLRMIVCILISAALMLIQGDFRAGLGVSPMAVAIALGSGASMAVFLVTWLLSVQSGAFMLVNVFTHAGLVVPLVFGIFYGESVSPIQWLGVAVLLAAVYLMIGYNQKLNGKMKLSDILLLTVVSISSGLNEYFVGKAFSQIKSGATKPVFSFYSYIFCFLCLLIFYLLYHMRHREKTVASQILSLKPVYIYTVLMSVCLFLNTYFKTAAGEHLSSIQLYPVNVGATLVLSTFVSAIFFKEIPDKRCIAGLILNFAALIIINCLPSVM